MSSQRNQSDSFHFKRAAFYQSLQSKVGLAAAKSAALGFNLNVDGCGIEAAPVHERECCLLVLNSVTSTPQWIRQPEAALQFAVPFFSPSFFHTISLSPTFTSA
jgi:hypothetical protein